MNRKEQAQPPATTVIPAASEYEADLVVESRRDVARDVAVITLREASGHPLPSWEPGAHIDLFLGEGITRQYSLCGDPADHGEWRIGVLRERAGRGGSARIYDSFQPGTPVRMGGPRNHFVLVPAPRYLFIAGGIGITPLLQMIASAQSAGADWELVYGGRERQTMAFLDELARYGNRVSVRPQDEFGLLDLDGILAVPREGALVYCCGPEPLLAAVEERTATWPAGSLRVERFTARPLSEPVRDDSFEVRLSQSGMTLTIPPGKSILEVMDEAGLEILSSCEEGVCGTCETAVLDGEPDHRDSVLSDEERASNTCMMICVSRSRGPLLVLDL